MLSWGWGFDNKKSNMNKLNEWGFRYTWYMPLINQRDTWLIWLRYAWDMTEIWLRHALDMPELCLRDAWDMPYMTHMTDTCGWDMSEICLRGAIIKKTENFGKNSLMGGGGVKFCFKTVQFQFGSFENPGLFKNVPIWFEGGSSLIGNFSQFFPFFLWWLPLVFDDIKIEIKVWAHY